MISKKLNKVVASVILVAMLFTTFPVAFANADKYPAYEFVITADKTSVKTDDVLTITVTTNGPLANASMVQYQIVFNPQQFKTTTARKTALDSTWFSTIEDGENFGAISTKPQLGLNPKTADLSPNATQQIFTLVFVDSAVSGETDDGDPYSLFVPESNTETTAVAGKILFTALTDIADVSDCFTVINAKNEYSNETGSLKDNLTGTIVQLSETMAVQKTIDLIDEIDSTVTYSSKSKIEAARAAYDAITNASLKALVTNASKLTAAEQALEAITDKMEIAKGLIVALDSESTTFEADITAAETAFNALASDAKAALTGYAEKIQAAKDTLAAMKKEAEDKAAANVVVGQIDALFPVTLDSAKAISDVEAAYEALTPAQQAYVTNYVRISEAKEKLAALIAQKQAAEEVSKLIENIPDVITKDNVVSAREAIDTAKVSYDALDAKELVPPDDVTKLEWALEEIVVVEKAVADASAMDKAIEALYPVRLTSGDAIAKAENDFTLLSALAQSYVTKADKLAEARDIYTALVAEETEVQTIIGLIDALGSVKDIDYGTYAEVLAEANVVKARLETLYETPMFDQSRVKNRNTLTEIIDKCLELQESQEKIDNVIEKINSLGEITLNSSAAIDVARGLYEELSDIEQAMVSNYGTLIEAEETLAQLEAEAEQEEIDRNRAAAVDALIAKIEEVSYTPECWSLINEARQAYGALTDTQKEYVENFEALDAAEKTYKALEADFKAVDEVIRAINKIGTVVYSEECLERIQEAERLYGELDGRLKGEVTNAYMIEIAKANYESAKKDYEAVQAVISKIDSIDDIDYTKETFELLTEVQNAFNALGEELQKDVTNKQDLLDAWEAYNSMKPVVSQKNDIADYNGSHITVVTNVPENMTVSFGNSKASVVLIDEVAYHVLVTPEIISADDVVVTDSIPETQILGNVLDNDTMITAMDAQVTNQVAAKNTVSVFETDPMAFVRADVNGDGRISVVDALMIAKHAAGDTVQFKLAVGMIIH